MRLPRVIERSIRHKVTLLVLAITVSALVLTAAGLVIYDLRLYERQYLSDLTGQAQVLARATGPALQFNDPENAAKDLSLMQARSRVVAAALYARDGRLFATYEKAGEEPPNFPERPPPDGYAIDGDHLVLVQPVIENSERIGTVYIRGLYLPWARLKDYLTILLGVMIASLAVAVLLSGWLQNTVTAPILEVARVSHAVMERKDYSLRAQKTTEDEIGELVDAFNAMLAEIGRRSAELRDADRRKDEFLATLAHELRNPLAPIRNALEILKLAGDDAAKAARARDMMQRQVAQMVRLVDDLLDVSRITTGKLAVQRESMDLSAALQDAVETARPFIEARGHHLQIAPVAGTLHVMGDRTRLAQVFSNLLNNAAKYTEQGGRIVLAARREGGEAVVSVKDNGIGLTEQSMARIFGMFEQVDRSLERTQAGLGVGLTLAKRLVELHEGRIEVKSGGAGQGSEFIVRLPLRAGAAQEATVASAGEGPRAAARRVLLADDNVDFANSLGQLLAARGHEVRIAYDGAQALEAADEFKPQVAFVDLGMPKVHGYEVARRLKSQARTAGCLLVAVTGWGQENDRRRAREAGFDRHLVKPVDPAQIEAIVEGG